MSRQWPVTARKEDNNHVCIAVLARNQDCTVRVSGEEIDRFYSSTKGHHEISGPLAVQGVQYIQANFYGKRCPPRLRPSICRYGHPGVALRNHN